MVPTDPALAVMVLCAGDLDTIFTQPGVKAGGNPGLPAPTDEAIAYVNSGNFAMLAQLRADDLFITKGQNVYYGLVLRVLRALGPYAVGDIVVAVRGTMDLQEWVNDACAEVLESIGNVPGMVGAGFWAVYESMAVHTPAGARFAGSAAQAIATIAGPGANVFVVGHSLGAALATYLAMDLQPAYPAGRGSLTAAFFASPKPGSSDFADGYQARVASYTLVDFAADLVPWTPSAPAVALKGGGAAHNVKILPRGCPGAPPSPEIDPVQNHDPAYYARMLDPTNARASALLASS